MLVAPDVSGATGMSRIRTSHRANRVTTIFPGTGPHSWGPVNHGSGSHGPGRVPVHHTSAHRLPRRRRALRADPARHVHRRRHPSLRNPGEPLGGYGGFMQDGRTTRPSSCAAFVVLDGTDPADAEPGIAPFLRTARARRRPASRDDRSSHNPSGSGKFHHAPQHRLTAPHPGKRVRIMPVEQNFDLLYPFKDGVS